MADRPKGYGMTAELKEKQASKYDPQLERDARNWLEAVVGEPFPDSDFHKALKNGIYLCKAINKLQPGSVPKINTSTMAFKMMENIGKFLDAIGRYGVSTQETFQTVDLFEGENMHQVVLTIHALGRKARSKGFTGATLGPKEAAKNVRAHDPNEQKVLSQSTIGLQMGSNRGATQAGMTPYGLGRQINKPNLKYDFES